MAAELERHDYDVLIIGAGGAGLRAAIAAREAGMRTAIVCKSLFGKAHTVMAEGGIAASMGNVNSRDSWEVHFRDTMRGGKFLNSWRMAELHAKEAPDRVWELETYGALFDRTSDGRISQRNFGGHEYPRLAHFYRHLASVCRLIIMDKRGIGLSDRVPPAELPGLELRADDLRAVLDDAGVARAAVVGASDGGPLAALFAATFPERTDRLVLINTYARRIRAADYPWGPSPEEWAAFQDELREHWGGPLFVPVLAPAHDETPSRPSEENAPA